MMPDIIDELPADAAWTDEEPSPRGKARSSSRVVDSLRSATCASCPPSSSGGDAHDPGGEDAEEHGVDPDPDPDPDAPHPALHYDEDDQAGHERTSLLHQSLSLREATVLLARAEEEKAKGNELFKSGDYAGASERYGRALELAPLPDDLRGDDNDDDTNDDTNDDDDDDDDDDDTNGDTRNDGDINDSTTNTRQRLPVLRAVLFANRAACRLHLDDMEGTVDDCCNAIALDETNVKAFVRRAKAFEALEEYERGLEDAERVLKLGGYAAWAEGYVRRVGPIAEQRREAMKEEMMEKLKDLGNAFLGNFGLSLDNFKAEQGPDGGYSIKFGQ